jgi:23S rRNA-/tRNA-specific pseudouridylate synthase
LVLHKPSGLATTSPDPDADTLVRVAQTLDPHAERLHPSSRLDAEVSGLVTFARSASATRFLLDARAANAYRRVYLALSLSPPTPREGSWSGAIEIDPRDARKRRIGTSAKAKPARTEYRTLCASARGAVLWLEPRTGRTHQLRVHAAAAGLPLLGDRPYGGAARLVLEDGRAVAARRVMLHCLRVTLPARVGGDVLSLEAMPPGDFVERAGLIGGEPLAALLERER